MELKEKYLSDLPSEIFCLIWNETQIYDVNQIISFLNKYPGTKLNLNVCLTRIDITGNEIISNGKDGIEDDRRLRFALEDFPNIKKLYITNIDLVAFSSKYPNLKSILNARPKYITLKTELNPDQKPFADRVNLPSNTKPYGDFRNNILQLIKMRNIKELNLIDIHINRLDWLPIKLRALRILVVRIGLSVHFNDVIRLMTERKKKYGTDFHYEFSLVTKFQTISMKYDHDEFEGVIYLEDDEDTFSYHLYQLAPSTLVFDIERLKTVNLFRYHELKTLKLLSTELEYDMEFIRYSVSGVLISNSIHIDNTQEDIFDKSSIENIMFDSTGLSTTSLITYSELVTSGTGVFPNIKVMEIPILSHSIDIAINMFPNVNTFYYLSGSEENDSILNDYDLEFIKIR